MLIKTLDDRIFNCDNLEWLGKWDYEGYQINIGYPGDEDCVAIYDSRCDSGSKEDRDYLYDRIWEELTKGSASFDMAWWLKEWEGYNPIKDVKRDHIETRMMWYEDMRGDMEREWQYYQELGITIEEFDNDVECMKKRIIEDFDDCNKKGDVDANISG